jgi:hypothetical protein
VFIECNQSSKSLRCQTVTENSVGRPIAFKDSVRYKPEGVPSA